MIASGSSTMSIAVTGFCTVLDVPLPPGLAIVFSGMQFSCLRLPGEGALPVVLHADHVPAAALGLRHEGLGKNTHCGVRGIFAYSVIVMHQHHESRTPTVLGVLEHVLIAVTVAKSHDRPTPDSLMDLDGFSALVIDPQQLRIFGKNCLAARIVAKCRASRRAHHLIAWNAVDPFNVRAHEILAASGDDDYLVAVGTQVLHHFEHRQVHKIGVEALIAWVLRRRDPVLDALLEYLYRHAGMGEGYDLEELGYPQLRDSRT